MSKKFYREYLLPELLTGYKSKHKPRTNRKKMTGFICPASFGNPLLPLWWFRKYGLAGSSFCVRICTNCPE
ncbi:hypothetical protein DN748_16575 [Sinomicrobium soli]|nr:hypothetical protein DN748_16575 [Sinomicrobium sp. N-1-3-6]